mmetsp:Transcript_19513/g.64510  ORF Transcript_19513/g.64510 Transcript_19513/m.64510 type:complete len:200 (+) Transcript_19513:17-616(+)
MHQEVAGSSTWRERRGERGRLDGCTGGCRGTAPALCSPSDLRPRGGRGKWQKHPSRLGRGSLLQPRLCGSVKSVAPSRSPSRSGSPSTDSTSHRAPSSTCTLPAPSNQNRTDPVLEPPPCCCCAADAPDTPSWIPPTEGRRRTCISSRPPRRTLGRTGSPSITRGLPSRDVLRSRPVRSSYETTDGEHEPGKTGGEETG